ncbi:hypothetical protein LIER_19186 [Lithospermum erythrorhizon]|uniref:Aminotransferase-like plant mobile domain-containing protein n=1 Tax=Lithospermum erythrorhizon TaxID=34254 RepID=A0AAV3QJH9_LITER
MVTFSTEGEHPNLHLHIHDHEEDEDTILAAHSPLYKGSFPPWGALDGKDVGGSVSWTPGDPSRAYVLASRGHTKDKPPRIYRILREDVAIGCWSWHSSIALHGLFEYTPAGHVMDEVVPSAECLSSSLDKKEDIPKSCRYLLHPYDSLANFSSDSFVSPVEWISFWSALPRVYTGPLAVQSNRAGSSCLPCYPYGSVPAHGSRSTASLRVFKRLGVPSYLLDEVYCDAFFSYCSCVFVLPLDITSSICPTVFKMASSMAAGKSVSLAIPVLESIYRGLHLITTACYPNNSGSCFPFNYLLGWMGTYLRTCSVMKRYPPSPHMVRHSGMDRCTPFSLSDAYQYLDEHVPYWAALRPSRPTPHVFTDNQLDSKEDMAFFFSLRTNMVGYREDAFFLLEVYNPHRFSKQLGFSPAIPGFKS